MRSPAVKCFNMKGKKTLRLKCGCCMMFNFKEKYNTELAKKEIRSAKYSLVCD